MIREGEMEVLEIVVAVNIFDTLLPGSLRLN